jgi:ATP-dependent Clp protease ATP-binding subunit ClpB
MIISKHTGIPLQSMLIGEREKLLQMEKHLMSKVIGQDEAISAIRYAQTLVCEWLSL